MAKVAIRVDGIGKQYVLGGAEKSDVSFREMLTGALATPFRRLRRLQGERAEGESFWALKNIDIDIKVGDVVGVIGRNGAGKSTLLKILSRITDPTEGKVEIRGRVSSLLEVGTGFHPELTGRENIFLNGAILGMSRREILNKFDEIVAFAEVERFLDTPVKRYSSGMYVRLAFAVAAHLEPEILVVDEVLAVGDATFQKKCLGKMQDVGQEGRTVLFVSHNMGAIRSLCQRAICLHQGSVAIDDTVDAAIEYYLGNDSQGVSVYEAESVPEHPHFRRVVLYQEPEGDEKLWIDRTTKISFEIDFQGVSGLEVGLMVTNAQGICVHHTCSPFGADMHGKKNPKTVVCEIPPYGLGSGKHYFDIMLYRRNHEFFERIENALSVDVIFTGVLADQTFGSAWKGAIGPGLAKWSLVGG